MRVNVDETWSDHFSAGIDHPGRIGRPKITNLSDGVRLDSHIGLERRAFGPVDDLPVFDQEIEHLAPLTPINPSR